MTVSPLRDEEALLRRFNPNDSSHVTYDEGSSPSHRLNWAALEWHDDGCSVYREDELSRLGLSRDAITDEKYCAIAASNRSRVVAFEHADPTSQQTVRPFSAHASPRTEPPPLATDEAHASVVVIDAELSKKQLGKAQRRLAANVFDVILMP